VAERFGLYDVVSGRRLRTATREEWGRYKEATGGYYVFGYGLCDVKYESPPLLPSGKEEGKFLPEFNWFDSVTGEEK
jgi:hypothetical protein